MGRQLSKQIRSRINPFIWGIIFQGFLIGTISGMEDCHEGHATSLSVPTVPSTRTTPMSLDKVFFTRDASCHDILGNRLISFLSSADKAQMRLLAARYRDYVDLTFFGPVYDPHMQMMPFSSEISGGTIGSNILRFLGAAQSRIIIASDKCTNEEFLDDLLALPVSVTGRPLDIRIVTGEDPKTQATLPNPKYAGVIIHQAIPSNSDRSGKMHNKFIVVDDTLLITGSPNLTFAAYNYNVESFVAIQHRFVARLYLRYYEYIVSGKNKYDHRQEEYQRVRKMMEVFNKAPGNPIQVCLAPILDISTFVVQGLNSSQVIDINMFLVSRASAPDNDIVDNLLRAVRGGAGVTIKVDGGQYRDSAFMRAALTPFKDIGQLVYTVSKNPEKMRTKTKEIRTIPQFHDKLVLIRHRDGSKKVLIGSAGFTDNVQDNLNLENMVLLEGPAVYDMLLNHFRSINDSRGNLVVTKL